jgi:hypothetical protein
MSRASRHVRVRTSKFSMTSRTIPKSPPAEKVLPAPVMMAQFTLSSASRSRQIRTSSACMAASAVFIRPLSMVMRSTRGCGRSKRSRW